MFLRICAAVLFVCMAALQPALAQTPAGSTTIVGRILETSAGLPVTGAKVDLRRNDAAIASTTTAADGSFTFGNVAPGSYSVFIDANGYQPTLVQGIVIESGLPRLEMQTALAPQTGNLKEIYTTTVNSRAALQTSATINNSISPQLLQNQNYFRAGDALGSLPFVTTSTSSSIGDDESLSIRGFDPTETATLLDGHPIGPIGAQGGGYDYQMAQFYGLSNIGVIYGSGATGLYGVPTIAGAVNFETLNPTPQDHVSYTQGIGNFGKLLSGLTITGTAGRLGYAAAYGVQGTDGQIGPSHTVQTGLLGTGADGCGPGNADTSSGVPTLRAADVAACSYLLSGAYTTRNFNGKLQYHIDSKTSIELTAFNASYYAESGGNGDTDYLPYEFQLANAPVNNNGTFTINNGTKITTNCSSTTVAVLNDSQAGYECLTPQQYASSFYGPAGGGVGRFHSGSNQDYDVRLSRRIGAGTLVLDGFIDNYNTLNVKGLPPSPAYNNVYLTHGGLIRDEFAGLKNDFAFGVSFQHQLHRYNQGTIGVFPVGLTLGNTTYFVSDTYTPTDRLSLFGNFGFDRSQNTRTTNFDPRLSVVYRPTNNDVVRLTGGRSTSEPDPTLLTGGFQFTPFSGSFNAFNYCNGQLAQIGNGQSPNLEPERDNDFEAAVAHRFANNATVEVDAYDSIETNPIVGGVFPLSIVPAAQQPSAAFLAPYINNLNLTCGKGNVYSAANLGVGSSFNAGQANYRGLNASLKYPLNRQFTLQGGYTSQVAYYSGLSTDILANNSSLINGAQFYGVPTHTASLGLKYENRPGQVEVNLDAHYVGGNNSFNRPAYWFANANFQKTEGPITFNLGFNNIFNSAASLWGLVGEGVIAPTNQYGTPQATEEFGLPYRQLMFTTTIKL